MTQCVTFWEGSPLTHLETLCLASFLDRGHSVELFSYSVAQLPDRLSTVPLRNAEEVLPVDSVVSAMLKRGQYSRVANLFRYRALGATGLTWVDADIYLVADDLPRSDLLFGLEDETYVNNAVLRLPPNHPLLQRLVEETSDLDPERSTDGVHGTFGPRLLTTLVDELQLRHLALEPDALYPIRSRDLWRLFDPCEAAWCEEALAQASTLHLWNEFLRRAGVRDRRPPRGSWLDRALMQHQIISPRPLMKVREVRNELRQVLPDAPAYAPPKQPLQSVRRVLSRQLRRIIRKARRRGR